MRLDRLDLIRYGCFTDTSLVFKPADCDFHIVFGPNEAGKSTALAAIEDLLFGIPRFTPYSFLHDNSALRLGGVLTQADQRIEFHRRKGIRDTVLAPDETILPRGDAAIAPFVNGMARLALSGMFSLNHERLATGGKEMLEAKGEAGQAIFSAGTGLVGLRKQLRRLEEEADALWAPRHSRTRACYVALDALKAAENRKRDCMVSASKLQQATHAHNDAQEAFAKLERGRQQKAGEQQKLGRIRRVHRNVQRVNEIDAELAELGEPVAFHPDAESQLATALGDRDMAQSSIDALNQQLGKAEVDRKRLVCDDHLLARTDDVVGLRQQRIEVQREKKDLPQRRMDLANDQKQLIRDAAELGWETTNPQAIIDRIPARSHVALGRELATEHGALQAAADGAKAAVDEAVERIAALQADLQALPEATDVGALEAALGIVEPARDVTTRIAAAERKRASARASADGHLSRLKPAVATPELLEALSVPPLDTVRSQRDEFREQQRRSKDSRDQVAAKERELASLCATLAQRTREEQIATRETLDEAREARDAGWHLIRNRYIDKRDVPASDLAAFCGADGDMPTVFEQKTHAADALADQRFDKAQAAGELAVIDNQVKAREIELEALRVADRAVEGTRVEWQQSWAALWAPCSIEPNDPDFMIKWMEEREAVLTALAQLRDEEGLLATLMAEEAAARNVVSGALRQVDPHETEFNGKPLRFLIERASRVCQEHQRQATERKSVESQIRKAATDEARKRSLLRAADGKLKAWQTKWNAAMKALSLPTDTSTGVALEQLDVIDGLRALADQIARTQRDRIDKMERDIDEFDRAVETFVKAVAGDLSGVESADAVVKLEQRHAEAKQIKTQQDAADTNIAGIIEQRQASEVKHTAAEQVIQGLQRVSGSQNLEQLQEALRRSARAQARSSERAKLTDVLAHDGDGHTLDELRAECADMGIDAAEVRSVQLKAEIEELERQLEPATATRLEAEKALAAIGDGNDAALAEAEREEALADLRDTAERYVRARTAVVLLQWAVDQYQREKQDPLVRRASALFASLTAHSFVDVRAEFDDEDHAKLVGMRADDTSVDVTGMSDGTADQLYLALRLAAVHEHLDQSPPMPFIADDLLVNFDDARSAAALTVLSELAHRTQVLFFTHHRHLVELAKGTLGERAQVVSWVNCARVQDD